MDIASLDREALKDIIIANDFDDKPPLNSSEKDLKTYLQGKIESGELTFDNMSDLADEGDGLDEELSDQIRAAAEQADIIPDSADGAGTLETDEFSDEEVEAEAPAVVSNPKDERLVSVSVLKKVFLGNDGTPTFPTFDGDKIPTTIVDMPLSMAQTYQKIGACVIRGDA